MSPSLRYNDPYLICADFDDYVRVHQQVDEVFREPMDWIERVVSNIANMGFFSSDRTIQQYADEIWGVKPCPVTLPKT